MDSPNTFSDISRHVCVVHRRPHVVNTITMSHLLISRRFTPATVTIICIFCSYQDRSHSAQRLGSGMEDLSFDSNLVHEFCLFSTPALGSTQPNAFVPDTISPRCETRHSRPTTAEVKNPWSFTSTWPCVFCSIHLLFHLSQRRQHLYFNRSYGLFRRGWC